MTNASPPIAMLPFQIDKPPSNPRHHGHRRHTTPTGIARTYSTTANAAARTKKKKSFGKRRGSSYDPRTQSMVPNNKRIPLNIHVDNKSDIVVMHNDDDYSDGKNAVNDNIAAFDNNLKLDAIDDDSNVDTTPNDDEGNKGGMKGGSGGIVGTGVSSLSAGTAADAIRGRKKNKSCKLGSNDSIMVSKQNKKKKKGNAANEVDGHKRPDGFDDELNQEGGGNFYGSEKGGKSEEGATSSSSHHFDKKKYAHAKAKAPVHGGMPSSKSMTANAVARSHTNDVDNKGAKTSRTTTLAGHDANKDTKRNNVLKSTKKKLSYGIHNDAKSKKAAALTKDERNVIKKKEQSKKKRRRSDNNDNTAEEERQVVRRSSSAMMASTTTTTIQAKKSNSASNKSNKGTATATNDASSKQEQERCRSTILSLVHTKSNGSNKHDTNTIQPTASTTTSGKKPSQRNQLLSMATRHQSTVVQYIATYHNGKSILDKNDEEHYIIDNGDLIIQQQYANVKGTYWSSKFSFRYWKLPGQRKVRDLSRYTSARPVLVAATTDGCCAKSSNGEEGIMQPRLVLDTNLSSRDASLVHRFVKGAKSGMAPFEFFSEDELERSSATDQDEDDVDRGTLLFGFDASSEEETMSLEEERRALKDKSNTLERARDDRDLNAVAPKLSKSLHVPRTKSARNKRKSESELSTNLLTITDTKEKKQKKKRTSIQFVVPAEGHQGHKYFGLIEGMGGGEEELERGSGGMPHRGRFTELPGSILPGKWQALVVDDAPPGDVTTEDRRLTSLRISFRHDGVSSSPLEAYYTGQEATPDGTVVSLINPSINRVSMFVKQGIFSDDEIDFCVEGEEVVSGDSHLSCLSLVAFEGFTSSSVSVIDGGDASQEILARCSQPTTGSLDLHELYDVPGGENDSIGVLFPLKVGFDFEYNFLISHDEQFRVNGLEVIFRKPGNRRNDLSAAALAEHRKNEGRGAKDVLQRFLDEHKHITIGPIDAETTSDLHASNDSDKLKQAAKEMTVGLSNDKGVSEEMEGSEVSASNMSAGRVPSSRGMIANIASNADAASDIENKIENKAPEHDYDSSSQTASLDDDAPAATEGGNQRDETTVNSCGEDSSTSGAVQQNEIPEEDIQSEGKQTTAHRMESDDVSFGGAQGCDPFEDADGSLPSESVEMSGNAVTEAVTNNTEAIQPQQKKSNETILRDREPELPAKTLVASYNDFEKGCNASAFIPTNDSELDDEHEREVSNDKKTKEKSKQNHRPRIGTSTFDTTGVDVVSSQNGRRSSLNRRKSFIEENDDDIASSYSVNHSEHDVNYRSRSRANFTRPNVEERLASGLRQSKSSTAASNGEKSVILPNSISKNIDQTAKVSRQKTSSKPSTRIEPGQKTSSQPSGPPLHKKVFNRNKSKRRATTSFLDFTNKRFDSAKKRRRHSADSYIVSRKKPKVVVVPDLFSDTESLFGCNIISSAKKRPAKDNRRLLWGNAGEKSRRKSALSKVQPRKTNSSNSRRSSEPANRLVSGLGNRSTQSFVRHQASGSKTTSVKSRRNTEPRLAKVETAERSIKRDNSTLPSLIQTHNRSTEPHIDEPQNNQADLELPIEMSDANHATNESCNNKAGDASDDKSIQSVGVVSCSFSEEVQVENESVLSSTCDEQHFHDVLFGLETIETPREEEVQVETFIPEPPVQGSQPIFDYYYGQEDCFDTEDEDEFDCQLLHSIYFGLKDSEGGPSNTFTDEEIAGSFVEASVTIPFHDYYFGMADFGDDDSPLSNSDRVSKRSPRGLGSVQTKPVFVMTILVGMLSRAFAYFRA